MQKTNAKAKAKAQPSKITTADPPPLPDRLPPRDKAITAFRRTAEEAKGWPLPYPDGYGVTEEARQAAFVSDAHGFIANLGMPGMTRFIQLAYDRKDWYPTSFTVAHATATKLINHALTVEDEDTLEITDPSVLKQWSIDVSKQPTRTTTMADAKIEPKKPRGTRADAAAAPAKPAPAKPAPAKPAPAKPAPAKPARAAEPEKVERGYWMSERDAGYFSAMVDTLSDISHELLDRSKSMKAPVLKRISEAIDEALEQLAEHIPDKED